LAKKSHPKIEAQNSEMYVTFYYMVQQNSVDHAIADKAKAQELNPTF
jgi:hypothetical protein